MCSYWLMRNMGNKKHIVIAAVLAMLGSNIDVAMADSANSLLQMDVKKSSSVDSVDVTFYTTSPTPNSVVTRKSNNKYVVLLPNTDSSSSITPSLGGVKDLISNIEVKHINDGIGGYTKITFSTTKPINIKTYTKKTNPLTQAQKDYKNIIAKNDIESVVPTPQEKPKTTSTTASKTTQKPQQATQKTTSNNLQIVNINNKEITNKSQTKPSTTLVAAPTQKLNYTNNIPNEIKTNQKTLKKVTTTNSLETQNVQPSQPVSTPKVTVTEAQPKSETQNVSPKDTPASTPVMEQNQAPITPTNTVENQTTNKTAKAGVAKFENIKNKIKTSIITARENIKNKTTNNKNNNPVQIPLWLLYAGGSVLSLGILYCILGALSKFMQKNKAQWEDLFAVTDAKPQQKKTNNYEDIVNNIELNWQEKYKRYNEKEEEFKNDNTVSNLSYVTDLSGVKKAIIPALSKEETTNNENTKPRFTVKKQNKLDHKNSTNNEEFKKQMRAKISNLEHSITHIPTLEGIADNTNKFKSEDDSIMKNISDVKLKSFSKPMSLKETHRSLLEDDKTISRNKSYKEGRFVKLKNSPLSMTKRKSAASDLNVSDLINTGSKYLMNNGEMKMSKENENYLLSSLDEYLSILDGEKPSTATLSKTSVAESLSQVKSSSIAMSRSGVTNPISRSSNPISGKASTPYMNGLVVKSGYNIDAEKGIYLVNIDGVSALVGRINSNVFILKKFDSVIDKPLQVRQDDANVYIVKAGRYKCLVDVSQDKMGTLIEI